MPVAGLAQTKGTTYIKMRNIRFHFRHSTSRTPWSAECNLHATRRTCSKRFRETELRNEVHRLLAERVGDDRQVRRALHEPEELRRLWAILGPVDLRAAVRVKRVDEPDEEVRHVPAPEHIREFRRVGLRRYMTVSICSSVRNIAGESQIRLWG